MTSSIIRLALVAFIGFQFTACKNANKTEENMETPDAATASAAADIFTVDTETSSINWEGNKPTGKHLGTINLASGELAAENRNIQSGNFVIDMKSIKNTDLEGDSKANLEAHLMGTVEGKEGDFFNVKQYPTATFELTSVEGEGGKVTVNGNLTIKDKTNPISFPAIVSFPGNTVFLKSQEFTIDRTKWGVNYGSKNIFDNLGDKFINDEIKLTIELHGNKQ